MIMAEKIAARVAEKGGRTFYVGGYVRDKLLGIENKDIDMLPETNKFIVVNSDKSIENLGFDEIRKRFEDGTYDFAGKSRRNIYKKWIGEDDTGYSHGFRA